MKGEIIVPENMDPEILEASRAATKRCFDDLPSQPLPCPRCADLEVKFNALKAQRDAAITLVQHEYGPLLGFGCRTPEGREAMDRLRASGVMEDLNNE